MLAGFWLALALLGAALWREQVVKTQEHRANQAQQSVRRVRLPAVRGLIVDRRGRCLARNRPSYCIALYVEELRQPGRLERTVDAVQHAIARVSDVIGLPPEVSRADIYTHLRKRMPMPFLAWRDISPEALARWCERGGAEPGVDIYVQPVREYPGGATLAHVLGYVGRADPDPEDIGRFHYYVPEVEGKSGVERTLNTTLEGEAGGRLLRVDASGFRHDDIAEKLPREGATVRLTIDLEIQRAAEAALGADRAAVVVIDPRNGDVLALASSPGFDPNAFCPSISQSEWDKLNSDAAHPLFNRAVSGAYPPGSTFKPVIAFAAMENGRAQPSTEYTCPGYFELGPVRIKCWYELGHGTLALRKAIEQSCNSYFCQLGLAAGYDRIYHMADALGFGHRTGIELPGEVAGLLPDDAWKRGVIHDRWRAGDTCNASIGQGFLTATPLQLAVFMATVGNGGTVYRPRLVEAAPDTPGEVVNRMNWSETSLRAVRGGMYDVIQAPTGTGRFGRIEGVEMAGKTGTAEFGPRAHRRRHTWMTVFAPYTGARYAVAMVVEEGLSGGRTVAPRIQALMTRVFQLEAAHGAPAPERGGA